MLDLIVFLLPVVSPVKKGSSSSLPSLLRGNPLNCWGFLFNIILFYLIGANAGANCCENKTQASFSNHGKSCGQKRGVLDL